MFGIKQLRSEIVSFKCAVASRQEKFWEEVEELSSAVSTMKKDIRELVIAREHLIEQKIPENIRRLNEMLLELKGLVCQIRADYQENKKERKDQKEVAVHMANELLYAIEARCEFFLGKQKEKGCCKKKKEVKDENKGN